MHDGSKVERAAVVSDQRGGEYFGGLARVIEALRSDEVAHRVLYLCADDETLLNRYKETRRRHPLAPSGNLIDGIRREAEALAPIRELADSVVDTSGLTRRCCGARSPTSCSRRRRRGGSRSPSPRSATSTARRATPTSPSTSASSRTRTTRRSCALLTGFDTRIVDYVGRDGRLEEFYERVDPAARVPAAAVRRRGQGAPRRRDRVHRRPPPLGRDRRAPRSALPFGRSVLHRDPAPRRRPRTDAGLSRPLASRPGS